MKTFSFGFEQISWLFQRNAMAGGRSHARTRDLTQTSGFLKKFKKTKKTQNKKEP
jgi:hypothetical protein